MVITHVLPWYCPQSLDLFKLQTVCYYYYVYKVINVGGKPLGPQLYAYEVNVFTALIEILCNIAWLSRVILGLGPMYLILIAVKKNSAVLVSLVQINGGNAPMPPLTFRVCGQKPPLPPLTFRVCGQKPPLPPYFSHLYLELNSNLNRMLAGT